MLWLAGISKWSPLLFIYWKCLGRVSLNFNILTVNNFKTLNYGDTMILIHVRWRWFIWYYKRIITRVPFTYYTYRDNFKWFMFEYIFCDKYVLKYWFDKSATRWFISGWLSLHILEQTTAYFCSRLWSIYHLWKVWLC